MAPKPSMLQAYTQNTLVYIDRIEAKSDWWSIDIFSPKRW